MELDRTPFADVVNKEHNYYKIVSEGTAEKLTSVASDKGSIADPRPGSECTYNRPEPVSEWAENTLLSECTENTIVSECIENTLVSEYIDNTINTPEPVSESTNNTPDPVSECTKNTHYSKYTANNYNNTMNGYTFTTNSTFSEYTDTTNNTISEYTDTTNNTINGQTTTTNNTISGYTNKTSNTMNVHASNTNNQTSGYTDNKQNALISNNIDKTQNKTLREQTADNRSLVNKFIEDALRTQREETTGNTDTEIAQEGSSTPTYHDDDAAVCESCVIRFASEKLLKAHIHEVHLINIDAVQQDYDLTELLSTEDEDEFEDTNNNDAIVGEKDDKENTSESNPVLHNEDVLPDATGHADDKQQSPHTHQPSHDQSQSTTCTTEEVSEETSINASLNQTKKKKPRNIFESDVWDKPKVSDYHFREKRTSTGCKNSVSNKSMNEKSNLKKKYPSRLKMNVHEAQKSTRKKPEKKTSEQFDALYNFYSHTLYPDYSQYQQLSAKIGVPINKIRKWFSDQRYKKKKDKIRKKTSKKKSVDVAMLNIGDNNLKTRNINKKIGKGRNLKDYKHIKEKTSDAFRMKKKLTGKLKLFNKSDKQILENFFNHTPFPGKMHQSNLATKLHVTMEQVYGWFSNRRTLMRKLKMKGCGATKAVKPKSHIKRKSHALLHAPGCFNNNLYYVDLPVELQNEIHGIVKSQNYITPRMVYDFLTSYNVKCTKQHARKVRQWMKEAKSGKPKATTIPLHPINQKNLRARNGKNIAYCMSNIESDCSDDDSEENDDDISKNERRKSESKKSSGRKRHLLEDSKSDNETDSALSDFDSIASQVNTTNPTKPLSKKLRGRKRISLDTTYSESETNDQEKTKTTNKKTKTTNKSNPDKGDALKYDENMSVDDNENAVNLENRNQKSKSKLMVVKYDKLNKKSGSISNKQNSFQEAVTQTMHSNSALLNIPPQCLQKLEKYFTSRPKPIQPEMELMAENLDLDPETVKIWFSKKQLEVCNAKESSSEDSDDCFVVEDVFSVKKEPEIKSEPNCLNTFQNNTIPNVTVQSVPKRVDYLNNGAGIYTLNPGIIYNKNSQTSLFNPQAFHQSVHNPYSNYASNMPLPNIAQMKESTMNQNHIAYQSNNNMQNNYSNVNQNNIIPPGCIKQESSMHQQQNILVVPESSGAKPGRNVEEPSPSSRPPILSPISTSSSSSPLTSRNFMASLTQFQRNKLEDMYSLNANPTLHDMQLMSNLLDISVPDLAHWFQDRSKSTPATDSRDTNSSNNMQESNNPIRMYQPITNIYPRPNTNFIARNPPPYTQTLHGNNVEHGRMDFTGRPSITQQGFNKNFIGSNVQSFQSPYSIREMNTVVISDDE